MSIKTNKLFNNSITYYPCCTGVALVFNIYDVCYVICLTISFVIVCILKVDEIDLLQQWQLLWYQFVNCTAICYIY